MPSSFPQKILVLQTERKLFRFTLHFTFEWKIETQFPIIQKTKEPSCGSSLVFVSQY